MAKAGGKPRVPCVRSRHERRDILPEAEKEPLPEALPGMRLGHGAPLQVSDGGAPAESAACRTGKVHPLAPALAAEQMKNAPGDTGAFPGYFVQKILTKKV